jgi:hypothetical protein
MRLTQMSRPISCLTQWRDDSDGDILLLNPPYQRGDVWGLKRRRNLIRSILLGVPIPSLIINNRFAAKWDRDYRMAVIDGRQRITTLLMFLDGVLAVPGEWFGYDQAEVRWGNLSIPEQRGFRQRSIAVSEGQLPTIEHERQVFDLVNFGGIAQGERDDQ